MLGYGGEWGERGTGGEGTGIGRAKRPGHTLFTDKNLGLTLGEFLLLSRPPILAMERLY